MSLNDKMFVYVLYSHATPSYPELHTFTYCTQKYSLFYHEIVDKYKVEKNVGKPI